MNAKTLHTLEYYKILARLKEYAAFSASAALAESLRPTSNLTKALERQAATREARHLINTNDAITFAGATDLRPLVSLAQHDGTLEPGDLLAIKNTLIVSRSAKHIFEDAAEEVPYLANTAGDLADGLGLIDTISKTISDRGEVLDSASEALAKIRSELKVTYERLMDRLMRYINDPTSARFLQDTLITQRSGRYVLPLRAEFKGRIKAIIHDMSSSGATLFIEPLTVVEWNNRYRELQLEEREEIRRVLFALSQRVAEQGQAIDAMVAAMAQLDLSLMMAKYAEALHASEPEMLPFKQDAQKHHPGSTVYLLRARHPLLDPATVVPIDVVLDNETFALVITGPNTGGKTVTLKTVGLFALMAQSGMQIPALSGSKLSIFRDVFADIGDEQSIEQSLSTFSGHITQLVAILKRADSHSLVLLDELGAGTDPQEGSALARAVLTHLLGRRITSLVATHYPELKAYAHATPGVVNASVEFDLQTLKPTYHLTIGLPGRSNALAIAERLGLRQDIIAAAKAEINPADLRAEDLLDEIYRQRDLAREALIAADKARMEAESMRDMVAARLEAVEDERLAILEGSRLQSQKDLDALRGQIEALRREMARARQPLDVVEEVEEIVEELEEVVTKVEVRKPAQKKSSKQLGPLRLGEKVFLKSIGQEGVITALSEDDLELQVGVLRVRARRSDVIRKDVDPTATPPEKSTVKPAGHTLIPHMDSPGLELDIRGERVEDAQTALVNYLERAYLAGLPYARIVHGKGTGRLRLAIRDMLKGSPHVKRWESGDDKEGGDGVTVVFLNNS